MNKLEACFVLLTMGSRSMETSAASLRLCRSIIQREETDFSKLMKTKTFGTGDTASRNGTVPGIFVYGIEELRGIQRVLGLQMGAAVELEYSYQYVSEENEILTETKMFKKTELLSCLEQLSAERSQGGKRKARANEKKDRQSVQGPNITNHVKGLSYRQKKRFRHAWR